MISAVARTSALSPCMFAVAQVVPSSVRPFVPAVTQKAQKVFCEPSPLILRNTTLSKQLLSKNGTLAVTGLTTGSQIRLAHTDIQVPDFGMYRRDSTKNATVKSEESNVSRKGFTYLLVGGGTVAAAYGGKNVAQEFIQTMTASADVLALAKIEVNLSDIAEGKSATFKWRNKPLFVRHRTAEEIAKEEAVDPSILRHKESDSDRVQRPEWLVILGICTHLGCVPIVGVGDYGGYYCPCHGSHYDGSGRIRKGPAPLNMEVPEYVFTDDTTLIVG